MASCWRHEKQRVSCNLFAQLVMHISGFFMHFFFANYYMLHKVPVCKQSYSRLSQLRSFVRGVERRDKSKVKIKVEFKVKISTVPSLLINSDVCKISINLPKDVTN